MMTTTVMIAMMTVIRIVILIRIRMLSLIFDVLLISYLIDTKTSYIDLNWYALTFQLLNIYNLKI